MKERIPQKNQIPSASQGPATLPKMVGGVVKMLEPMTMPMIMLMVSHRLNWPWVGPVPASGGLASVVWLMAIVLRQGDRAPGRNSFVFGCSAVSQSIRRNFPFALATGDVSPNSTPIEPQRHSAAEPPINHRDTEDTENTAGGWRN